MTYQINHQGSVSLAKMARAAGVRRFVYASSCSVYGVGFGRLSRRGLADQPSDCLRGVQSAASSATWERWPSRRLRARFLRNATAYGASPRMRFDIVLNDLCALAWTTKRIAMTSDGSPWRPVVHVEDICAGDLCRWLAPPRGPRPDLQCRRRTRRTTAFARSRRSSPSDVPGLRGLDRLVGGRQPQLSRVISTRSPRICPASSATWTARRGAEQLRELFERIEMTPDYSRFRAFTRLKQLSYLQRTGQIDAEFYWRT